VSKFSMVTFAVGTTAPLASLTRPLTSALAITCASAGWTEPSTLSKTNRHAAAGKLSFKRENPGTRYMVQLRMICGQFSPLTAVFQGLSESQNVR